jgi:NifU-like protein involved in Fe-S cluster formation
MIDDIYNARILEFAGNIGRVGRLAAPDATARAFSRLCGSAVTVDLRVEAGRVVDFAQEIKACALGQAAASIVAGVVVGASVEEVRRARASLLAMLKDNGPPPDGRFADLRFLEPVRDFKARHTSTMLVLDALCDCLDQLAASGGDGSAGQGAR